MFDIQGKMVQLHKDIIANDYYKNLYHECLFNRGITENDIFEKKCSDKQIVNLCNDFWMALPDAHHIRRDPFFDLCDIAEHVFLNDE